MDMLGIVDQTELVSPSSVGSNFAVQVRSIPSRISEDPFFFESAPGTETKMLGAALRRERSETEFIYFTDLYNRLSSPEETSSANSYISLWMDPFKALIPSLTTYQIRIVPSFRHDFGEYCGLQLPNMTVGIEPRASTLSYLYGHGHFGDLSSDSTATVSAYFDRLLDWIFTGIRQRIIESSIKLIYQIEDMAAVDEFLKDNAFLNDLLVEAHSKIIEIFGSETNVQLELIDDPDFRGNPKLYAVILTPLTAMEAMPIQERLDNAWWLGNLERAHGKFNIVLEYV